VKLLVTRRENFARGEISPLFSPPEISTPPVDCRQPAFTVSSSNSWIGSTVWMKKAPHRAFVSRVDRAWGLC
jgi:hypothetical protein